jgi:hypothetical protein
MPETEAFLVISFAFVLAATVLSALVISLRRIGLRLDKWFFRAIPLRKIGFEVFSHYVTVAMIWLFPITLLLADGLIGWSTAIIASNVVQ